MTLKLLDFAQVTDEYVFTKHFKTEGFRFLSDFSLSLFFFNCKHFIQVSVKEYLWKCMHSKIVPFKYIKVFKELFALMSFGSIVTVCDNRLTL